MKKIIYALLLLAVALPGTRIAAQTPTITNRYAMKLSDNGDGTYSLQNRARYEKLVDLSAIDDLLVPYVYEREKLFSKDYKGVEVKELVYRSHKGYELKLAIDMAVSESPTPVVFYLHGGGWARGSKDAYRTLSQYMAKQKGVTGVRIAYSLAPQPDVDVRVSIDDVLAAVQYIRDHAKELNIDVSRMGFVGTSAGAHLAAVGAMRTPETKVFVGRSGIYNLETARICQKTRDEQRIEYFCDRDPRILRSASPVALIPKKRVPATMLFCGTADITVEYSQSEEFAEALKRRGGEVELVVYPNYDHNVGAKASDKMEEIHFKTVDFLAEKLLK